MPSLCACCMQRQSNDSTRKTLDSTLTLTYLKAFSSYKKNLPPHTKKHFLFESSVLRKSYWRAVADCITTYKLFLSLVLTVKSAYLCKLPWWYDVTLDKNWEIEYCRSAVRSANQIEKKAPTSQANYGRKSTAYRLKWCRKLLHIFLVSSRTHENLENRLC